MDQQIQKVLEEQLAVSKEILRLAKSNHRHIMMQNVMGWVKTAIFIAPLVFAYIYLWPNLQQMLKQYQDLLNNPMQIFNSGGGVLPQGDSSTKGINLQDLLKGVDLNQLQKSIKK